MIRPAEPQDLPRLLELDRLFWAERQEVMDPAYRHTEAPMPEELMRLRVCGDHFCTFVTEIDDNIVGYLVAKVQAVDLPDGSVEKEGRICDVFVLAAHRSNGIASDLYAQACRWFDEQSCDSQGLTVYANSPALTLYEHWGFAPFSINMRKRRPPPAQKRETKNE